MAFPRQFLDELSSRLDIVDVVSEYVPLVKKSGRYWACCPFHSEKTPSFTVSPERQIYKCFGCGKGGSAINFVMEYEHLSFVDAVAVLAKKAGLEMPAYSASPGQSERRKRLLQITTEAARWYHSVLRSPEGQPGLAYLRGRGLSPSTITRFGLGFAPDSWDGLIRAMAGKGMDKRDLLDAGLCTTNKDGRIYDRFRGRAMFPIIDVRGDVIGFGGRIMADGEPKYLNSPDSLIFDKGRNMFGLNFAKKTKADHVILTEGYMDTIALHQAGFDNAVASLGTSLTEEQARLLVRYFHSAVISYDGDQAGIKAAQRAIPILEKAGMSVRVIQITGAKDPDEYIKTYGRDAFARLVNQSENQVDYQLRQMSTRYDLSRDDQRVGFIQEAARLLAALPSAAERDIYGRHAAEMGKISPEVMAEEVRQAAAVRNRKERRQAERRAMNVAASIQPAARQLRYTNLRSAPAEEGIISLLLSDPSLIGSMDGLKESDFSSPMLGKVYRLIEERALQGLPVHPMALTEELTQDEMNQLVRIADRPVSQSNSAQAVRDCLDAIRREALRRNTDMDADEQLRAIQKNYQTRKSYTEG